MNEQPRRRWFRFSLRTLFVVVTGAAVTMGWLAYNVRWIQQRHAALLWLKQHEAGGAIGFTREKRAELSWSIGILGEKPLELLFIGARDDERSDLAAYRTRVAEYAKLFPECQIVDLDEHDWIEVMPIND